MKFSRLSALTMRSRLHYSADAWKSERLAPVAAVAVFGLVAGANGAQAQSYTWIGSGPSAGWDVSTNWSPNGLPTADDDVLIGQHRAIVDDTRSVGTIVLNPGALTIEANGSLTFQHIELIRQSEILEGSLTNLGTATGSVGNGGMLKQEGGDWFGNVELNSGYLESRLGSSWTGDIWENTGLIFNSDTSIWNGNVENNSGYIDNVDREGTWNGDILINSGDDAIIFNGGAWNGHVITNDAFISNYYAESVWTGDVRNNADTIYNAGIWIGNVEENSGVIESGSFQNDDIASVWTGDVRINTGTISSIGVWNGALTSSGLLILENQVNGAIDNSGTLQVNADLSGITALTNSGLLTMTHHSGAQTLSGQSASFGSSGTLLIDVDATGASDRITLTGAATLGGAVHVTAAAGPYERYTSSTILSAGSISGRFDEVVVDLAFLAPRLIQDGTTVTLALMRNDMGFASLGVTPTQIAVGTIVEALGAGNTLFDAVLWLDEDEAAAMFDTLSGTVYPATEMALIDSAARVAGSLADRIGQSFDALASTGNLSAYAPTATDLGTGQDAGLWARLYGASRKSAEAGGVESAVAAGGLVAGLDGAVGDWRVGLMLNAGTTQTEIGAQTAGTTSTDYGLGLYAGREWGQTRLSLGGTFTGHDIEATRNVTFTDFSETLSASYGATTAVAFTELSHEIDLGALSVTPFGSLTRIRHATDGFTETGGEAALAGEGSVTDATHAVLGLGIGRQIALETGVLVTARASLGWRRTISNRSDAEHGFVSGGSFSPADAADTDTMLVGADLNFDLDAMTTLDLGYDGRLGAHSKAHALKLSWTSRF
ncbi:autotransporter domain-containing protein [Arsenicitalea aurantiaca]|uniref:Autotransporter domain-containing protein n=1 Tax=Arsenicitalea aurantiaca TaxID=1783274 RepID=A0A433X7R3_9HYPH|nr:autotransporter domain-containing protein [Arsenicitalea aurantiaca]RUT30099.1 autotransporter domain-containing protein [Arsenicitalea aurantiaca]